MNDGYIELKDIRKDRFKSKGMKVAYGLWEATKYVFLSIGKGFRKLFESRPSGNQMKGVWKGFSGTLQKMAENAESWERAEKKQPSVFLPKQKASKKTRKKTIKKIEALPKNDFFTPSESVKISDNYWR